MDLSRYRPGTLFDHDPEAEAIQFIRKHEPPEGYFLGFSGGKDSVVLLELAKRAGVHFEAWYSATGIDPPEVVRFIRDQFPEVKWARPKQSLFALIPKRGYPNRIIRWCCDALKKIPTKDIPLRHRLMGLRAEESVMRANRARVDVVKKPRKQTLYKPIFRWLEWEIWQFIDENNLPYCSLYDEGFDRIGCVVCPFICSSNQAWVKRNRERWPGIYRAFEHSMRRLWDSKKFKFRENSFKEFLENWYMAKTLQRKPIQGLFDHSGDEVRGDRWA